MEPLTGKTALVVGASRGLGRGIAGAFATAGATVTPPGSESSEEQYLARLGAPVTPESAGAAFTSLGTADGSAAAYILTGEGLTPLSDGGV